MILNRLSSMMMTILAITSLMLLLGNSENIPFPSMGCPFKISCTHDSKIIELPAFPVPMKLLVNEINYTSQVLQAHDPGNCLPRLFLQHNFPSAIFPFRISSRSLYTREPPKFTNISFFDCSSSGQRYRWKDVDIYEPQQDMVSCPIYMAVFNEDMVYSNLVSCTKLSQPVSPLNLSYWSLDYIQQNSILLSWSETNFDKECLECKHKSKKKIILSSAGEIPSFLYLILLYFEAASDYLHFFMRLGL